MGCQALAVADGVVGVVVELAAGVGGRDEAVEGVVGVADDTVGGGHGCANGATGGPSSGPVSGAASPARPPR